MRKRTLLGFALAVALTGEAIAATTPTKEQVNINTATVKELQLLPRVGPALAQRIVDFRTANGPFKAPEEIIRVRGIGERSFALLQPYLTLNGATTLKEKVRLSRQQRGAAKEDGSSR
jgi:competence protein ComEA